MEHLSSKEKAARLISSAYFFADSKKKQKDAAYYAVGEILTMDYPSATQQDLEDHIEYWEDVQKHIKNFKFEQ